MTENDNRPNHDERGQGRQHSDRWGRGASPRRDSDGGSRRGNSSGFRDDRASSAGRGRSSDRFRDERDGRRDDRRGGFGGRSDERNDSRGGSRWGNREEPREFGRRDDRGYRSDDRARDDRGYGRDDRSRGSRDFTERGEDRRGGYGDRRERGFGQRSDEGRGYGRQERQGGFRRDDREDRQRRDERGGYGRGERGGFGGRDRNDRSGDRRFERRDDRGMSRDSRGGDRFGDRPEPRGDGGTRGPRSWDRIPSEDGRRAPRAPEPVVPEEITGRELDRAVRQQLRTLSKENADGVAKHLVAAGELMEVDPELALAHAQHAVMRAGRVPAAREALGLVYYSKGDFAEALREFRTARRLSGSDHLLPYMVDCERGLGRYERALELANSPEAQRLSEADNIELAIVVSGVRRDMGQARVAVVGLRIPALQKATTQPWAARLFYAYADALMDLGETAEAREWFVKADAADREGETDAADRIDEIDGIELTDLAPEEAEESESRLGEFDLSKPFGVAPAPVSGPEAAGEDAHQ